VALRAAIASNPKKSTAAKSSRLLPILLDALLVAEIENDGIDFKRDYRISGRLTGHDRNRYRQKTEIPIHGVSLRHRVLQPGIDVSGGAETAQWISGFRDLLWRREKRS
jgi:hypothetical protein